MLDAPDTPDKMAESDPAQRGGGDWARPLLERQLQMLGQLAEGGLEIARAIERQVTGAGSDEAPPVREAAVLADMSRSYARVARAVRLTLMLQSRMIQDLQARDATGAPLGRHAEAGESIVLSGPRAPRKSRVLHMVQHAVEAECFDRDVERLVREAAERLESDDFRDDLMSQPISEIVQRICADLGLDPDWPLIAEEAWTQGKRLDLSWLPPAEEPVRFISMPKVRPGMNPRRDASSDSGGDMD